jgi:hypothetical protein
LNRQERQARGLNGWGIVLKLLFLTSHRFRISLVLLGELGGSIFTNAIGIREHFS